MCMCVCVCVCDGKKKTDERFGLIHGGADLMTRTRQSKKKRSSNQIKSK